MIGATASAGGARSRTPLQRNAAVISLVVLEALWMTVAAGLLGKSLGREAEILSIWAVLAVVAGGYFIASRSSGPEGEVSRRRLALGALATAGALLVVARVDLSESLRLWEFGWVSDFLASDGDAWRRDGGLDHLLAVVALGAVWLRGAWLSRGWERAGLTGTALVGFGVLALAFAVEDGVGMLDTARALGLAFVVTGLAAVVFVNAGRTPTDRPGGLWVPSLGLLSTLLVLAVAVALLVLLVTGVVALLAETDAADPVLDALSFGLNGVAQLILWISYPFFFVMEALIDLIRDLFVSDQPEAPPEGGGDGDAAEADAADDEAPAWAQVLKNLARVFGVVALAALALWIGLRILRRRSRGAAAEDEMRESIWGERAVGADLRAAWQALRRRLSRTPQRRADTPIAELYFTMEAAAAARGGARRPAETPIQFAQRVRHAFRSDLPDEISRRFGEERYGGRGASREEVQQLATAWERARGAAPG